MIRIIMIMHHISLCISCIALYNYGHLLHIRVDHVEPKTENGCSEIHKRQVTRILTLLRIKSSPGAPNHLP
jgi:hypothetical protein